MVLMNDAPPTINLSETHGQSKFQLFSLAVRVNVLALPYRRGEGHILPRSNLHVMKVKSDWLLGAREKRFPGRHVGIQPSRQEWRRHIEHQDIGVVVRANPRPVLISNRFSPSLNKRLDVPFILGRGFLQTFNRHSFVSMQFE
jgi:hypothetical protein